MHYNILFYILYDNHRLIPTILTYIVLNIRLKRLFEFSVLFIQMGTLLYISNLLYGIIDGIIALFYFSRYNTASEYSTYLNK